MLVLAGFSVIEPEIGMVLWTTVVFLLVWLVLGKVAFKPISTALREREDSIDSALKSAEQARQEMANLNSKNEELLKEAAEERSRILKEAKETRDGIIKKAEEEAKAKANGIIANAQVEIGNYKKAALADVKNQAGMLALEVAEKVIRKELKGNAEQETFVSALIDDIKLN